MRKREIGELEKIGPELFDFGKKIRRASLKGTAASSVTFGADEKTWKISELKS